jgi:hypothetical protein
MTPEAGAGGDQTVATRSQLLILLLGLAFATQANSEASETDAVKRASERGHQIFVLDEAAWVSTDEMLRKLPDPRAAGVAGWIVEEQPDHLRSTYYRLKDRQPVALFTADTRGRTVISSRVLGSDDETRLTPVEMSMVQARDVASRQAAIRCTDGPMNTVVIPPSSVDQPIDVYVLSAQVRPNEYPFGGHQMFRIDGKGEITFQRKFTNACLNVPPTPAGSSKPEALFVTHLLDTTPTEIHVFTSLAVGLPVYVATPVSIPPNSEAHRLWKVDGEAISPVNETGS